MLSSSHQNLLFNANIIDDELTAVEREYPYLSDSPKKIRRSINAYREVLQNNRDRIRAFHDNKGSGISVCSLLSKLIDRVISHIATVLNISEKKHSGRAVIALGGYGRNELNPCSDIDLLFLIEENSEGIYNNDIATMIQFLWDINLKVGHSTRTSSECIEAAKDDTNLATSLLEARFLTGNEELWKTFKDSYTALLRNGEGIKLARNKIEERNSRLDSYHNTVKIQEPDVKESPGGLRDIHLSRWLLMMTGHGGKITDLYDSGFLFDYEIKSFEENFDFLLRVRNAMHFIAGKSSDLIVQVNLPDIAKNLTYTGLGALPTEKFMREYYMRADQVYRLSNHVVGRFFKRYEVSSTRDIKPHPSGLLLIGNKVGFPSTSKDFLHRYPVFLVRIFAFAGAKNCDISGYATTIIESTIRTFETELPKIPRIKAEFHEMINMRKGLGKSFRLMHEHGVLTKLIPEFIDINCHYQHNFYHAYTTDEHSIRVVENLEKIAGGTLSRIPELSEIMEDVTAKGALYLAGLLHDIGKGKGRAHSVRGERMAAKVLKRLGFDVRTIKLVQFLIREHLIMTHISQRRDVDDEDTIKDFIKRVGSTGRLRMLTLLTFADLIAVSDGAMTEWKKALLWRLYHKGFILIEKGYEYHVSSSRKRTVDNIIRRLKDKYPQKYIREHVNLLPDLYIRVTTPSAIVSHIRGIDRMKQFGGWASFHHRGDITLLTVISPDYPKALSDICGTITSSDINIVGARIFTREDGIIIDTFLVVNNNGDALIPSETQRMFKKNIIRVVAQEVDVKDLIRSHRIRWKRRKKNAVYSPPRIKIHNDISSKFTVVDVFAVDYTGLLYDITSVIASFNIDIHNAKIGTDEDQVADAFYLQMRGGKKIEDEKTLSGLTQALAGKLTEANK
ncbi:[protein-PII] uridylyltransferase [Candidatus Latescibacterota bacterium]